MRDISIVSCLWKFNDKPTLSKFMWKLKFLCIAKVCEDCTVYVDMFLGIMV